MQQTFRLRDLVPMLAIDVAIPYGLYVILSPHFPSNSLIPLLIAALPPAISGVVGVIRKGHIDYVGALVVLGIFITVVAAFMTGDQKIFLIRESILTAAFGVACLVSLLFPRPLMFYFGRQFVSGGDPAKAAFYSSLWQYPQFRFSNFLITLVWGIGLLTEFALRHYLSMDVYRGPSQAQNSPSHSIFVYQCRLLSIGFPVNFPVRDSHIEKASTGL